VGRGEFCHNPEVDLVLTYSSKAERWGDRPRERIGGDGKREVSGICIEPYHP